MTVSKEIQAIIKQSKTILVVGASREDTKASHMVPSYLQEQGYKIIPINPNAKEIFGEKAYHSIEEITQNVDIVQVFRPSEYTPDIVEKAVLLKPKLIWLQLGIHNNIAKKIAEKNNIKFVMDKCLMIEHMALKG